MRINNFSQDSSFTGECVPTIHLHPTSLCNLACRHCYSNSSPYAKSKGLDPEQIKPFLSYAYQNGFRNLSLSGGEPFLYDGLEQVIISAKDMGYKASVVTNGTLLKTSKAKKVLPLIDKLSISIDGVPMIHNEIRNDPRGFERILEGIDIANKYLDCYGILHTLTARSWDSLLWFGEFAYENNARFLQIHPLELAGRAAVEMLMMEVDQITLHKVYFLSSYMQNKFGDNLEIQLDFIHKKYVEKHPCTANVYPNIKDYSSVPLSEILNSIVIDENGDIVPVSYGFSRQFLIGNVHFFNAKDDIFGAFLKRQGKDLKNLFMQSYWKMVNDKDKDLFNVDEFLMAESLLAEVSENVA